MNKIILLLLAGTLSLGGITTGNNINNIQNKNISSIVHEENIGSKLIIDSIRSISNKDRNDNKESDQREDVKVTSKVIDEKKDYIKIDLKIPVIQGMDNTKLQSGLNSEIEKEIINFKDELEKQALKAQEYSKDKDWKMNPYEAFVIYNVNYNKDCILSLTLTYYEYTGGAHGLSNKVSKNIDLNTGKELGLKDFFPKGSDYKNIINKEIKTQMKNNPENYFPDAIKEFKGIKEDQQFYIKDKNTLVVYFGLYELAPYAAGIPEFNIPIQSFYK